ncbi:hypothetical protein GOP47_0027513 [Adiantum capillus-veneris]|nr:hypothetical protein GOP47_0027513 [Adiantum capillus-veneris]
MKSSMGKLSASEKEKTKLRERNRRSITTKIFQGLRKYGGYNLAPRADINEVLRCLAAEAGWTVEEDGTTYRTQAPTGGALRQLSAGRVSFSGGSLSGISGLMGSVSGGACSLSGGGNMLGVGGGGGGSGAVGLNSMGGVGGAMNSSGMGGLMSVGNGIFSLQPLDVGAYLDSRGGDCSTTASPRHQPASNNSHGSLFSPHHHPTTATPTPTSSISFMPSPFASPASSEVYPSSSRSTTTLTPLLLPTHTPQLFPPSFPTYQNTGYYLPTAVGGDTEPSPPPELKDDLLDALPLEYCQHQNLIAAAAFAARGQGQHQQLLLEQQQQEQERVASIFGSARLGNVARNPSFPPLMMLSQQQVHPFMQEARASNHNTPLGSPQHHG